MSDVDRATLHRMTETVRIRYVNPTDDTPVAFAPFLEARPGTVEPGDVFEVPTGSAEIMLRTGDDGEQLDPRWEEAGDADVASPYADSTAAELRDQLEQSRAAAGVEAGTLPRKRVDLIAELEELARVAPPIPEQPAGQTDTAAPEGPREDDNA